MRNLNHRLATPVFALCLVTGLGACTRDISSTTAEDTSASAAVAAVVSGALNSSSSSGTLSLQTPAAAPSIWKRFFNAGVTRALASGACPTPTNGVSGCSANGGVMTLTYSDCSFSGSSATWSGAAVLGSSSGSFSAHCGSYLPSGYSSNWILTRQFSGSLHNSPTTRTTGSGTLVELDTSSNVGDYNDDAGIGGGTAVTFSGTERTQLAIPGMRVHASSGSSQLFDDTVVTKGSPLTISDNGTTQTVTGSLTVYHNLVYATGTSTLQNVTFTQGCCTPTSGSIETTFTSTQTARYNGQTETLTFQGCGQALITHVDTSMETVSLPNCF
jgi:hypothetical protein